MPISDDELRRIFLQMDADGSGAISEKELRTSMQVLGVKVSGNSVKRVLSLIDQDGNGTIEWPEFQAFFCRVSNPDEIKKLLSVENQRFFEYKLMVESDPSFAKTFMIPPMISQMQKLEGHTGDVEGLAWISNTCLISGSIDGDVVLWDLNAEVEPGKPLAPTKRMNSNSLYTLAAAPDGRRFVTGHGQRSNNLNLWSIEEGDVVMRFVGLREPVYSCSYTPDGDGFVAGGKTGRMCLYSTMSETPTRDWQGHVNVVQSIDFRSDSSAVFCTSSRDGTVKVFDARSSGDDAQVLIEDAAASGPVNEALWRLSTEIVSCGDDYCIKRWDTRQAGKGPLSSYFGHTSVVRAIALSSDGRYLVSGTQSGSMRVWLADELGLVQQLSAEARGRQRRLEVQTQHLEDLNREGEGDIQELVNTTKQLRVVEGEIADLTQVLRQREAMACTQAKFGLEGPILPVNNLAWRDLGNDVACVACGCQDSSVRLFSLDLKELAKVAPWGDTTN